MKQAKVYILHENEAWVEPLFKHLTDLEVPFENWFINEGKLDLNSIPPEGIFYNRMSASSHTRDHRFAIEFSESILAWLALHGRKIVNNRNALMLEVRKSEQQMALSYYKISTPKTYVANNKIDVLKAAKLLNSFPFIVKPNRGGKGLGVRQYTSLAKLERDIKLNEEPTSLDGVLLVQEYVKPANGRITRAEFIGGKFYYAVSIDASKGFELCPADACNIEETFCPADSNGEINSGAPKFSIVEDYTNPDLEKYSSFLKASGIEVGAIEYIEDESGKRVVYDVNTNTNYNSAAESLTKNNLQGMKEIACYLKGQLEEVYNEEYIAHF